MLLVLFSIAYLLGSLPTAVWLGKWCYGKDLRDYGSGNAGATNTFRSFGSKAGSLVLLVDAFKGYAAVQLLTIWLYPDASTALKIGLGLTAVAGHIFPVLAQFRGGKGIATLLGVVIALHPPAALLAVAVFMVSLFSFRIVSLSSILATFSFPLWLMFRFRESETQLIAFSFLLILVVLVTHQKNIERLLNGSESRVRLKKKK